MINCQHCYYIIDSLLMEKKLCTFFEGYSVVQVMRINSKYSVNIHKLAGALMELSRCVDSLATKGKVGFTLQSMANYHSIIMQ